MHTSRDQEIHVHSLALGKYHNCRFDCQLQKPKTFQHHNSEVGSQNRRPAQCSRSEVLASDATASRVREGRGIVSVTAVQPGSDGQAPRCRVSGWGSRLHAKLAGPSSTGSVCQLNAVIVPTARAQQGRIARHDSAALLAQPPAARVVWQGSTFPVTCRSDNEDYEESRTSRNIE
jgi:hypothetical protein